MSKKRKAETMAEDTRAVAVASASQTQPAASPLPRSQPKAEGEITFLMYCVRKGIVERRRAGMQVWAKSKKVTKATFSEWETVFQGY